MAKNVASIEEPEVFFLKGIYMDTSLCGIAMGDTVRTGSTGKRMRRSTSMGMPVGATSRTQRWSKGSEDMKVVWFFEAHMQHLRSRVLQRHE